MRDGAPEDLSLTLDGAPWPGRPGGAPVGLRLRRVAGAPASLSVRLSLAAHDAAGLPRPGARLGLSGPGGALFDGVLTRREIISGPDGHVADLIARDDLHRLALRRTPGAEDAPSLHGLAGRAARRAGLAFVAHGADCAAGRHLNRFDDDLTFLRATLARYGMSMRLTDRGLEAFDLSAPPLGAPHDLTDRWTHLRAVDDPDRAAPVALTGWSAWEDRALTAPGGPRGPQAAPLRPEDPPERLRLAEQARRAPRWIEGQAAGGHDVRPGDAVADPGGGAPLMAMTVEIMADAAGGLRTHVSTRPPAPTPPAPAAILSGMVERTADPAGGGRVRVALHGYGGALTGWLPVAGAGAGVGTGLAAPLSPGDPVLVAAPEGDPEMGVVLGGLLRPGGPLAACTDGGARTGMVWRGDGLSVVMDEAKGRLALLLDGGAGLELSGSDVTLTAPGSLTLDCAGAVRIVGAAIDFEEA